MKRPLTIGYAVGALLLTVLPKGALPQDANTNKPGPYQTPEALLQLINARDSGLIDTNVFNLQLGQRGISFDLDAKTILELGKKGVAEAQIEEIEQACKQAHKVDLVPQTPRIPYLVFLSSGARFQNPYVVNVNQAKTSATLDNAGDSTAGFVEFTYLNRYVLRPPQENKEGAWFIWQGFGYDLPKGLYRLPDVEFRTGFNFANGTGSSSNTSFSAAAIAGGGDFYADTSFGLPLYRYNHPTQRHQISLEVAGGVTTEKSFEAVHPEVFAGLGYEASFKALGLQASTNACGYFMGRVGAGWVDSPRILSTTSSNTEVVVNGGLPKFVFSATPVASLGVRLLYPLTPSVYLTVDGNVYLKDNPTPWNISVGASIPFASISKIFGGVISGD